MQVFLLTLVPLLALLSTIAANDLDHPRWKSFDEAKLECARYLGITNETLQRYADNGYPDEPSDWKLVNCILINLNAWDEENQVPKDHVLSQYFYPSYVDCLYKEHTQECLRQNVLSLCTSDRLGRAYNAFQCYLRYSPGIVPDAHWIPYRFSEVVQTIYDCMHVVALGRDSLLQFCQGQILSNGDYPKLAYCFFTRFGFYNALTTGMDLEKVYLQFGNRNIISEESKTCIAEVDDQYCREPDRLFHTLADCLIPYLPAVKDISTAASQALGNPPECVVPPPARPKTQPCYNGVC